MDAFWKQVAQFVRAEDGPTATEYAVMLSFVILALVASITSFAGAVSDSFAVPIW